jgi:hypothetical protein
VSNILTPLEPLVEEQRNARSRPGQNQDGPSAAGTTTFNPTRNKSPLVGCASFLHCILFRVDAARPRLGRALRMAPLSRQT